MKIAIFDYVITPNNPVGSCHLRILKALCLEHEFTVFAVEFENPRPDRVRWVRIPAPLRPSLLLLIAYHCMAPLIFWLYRLRRKETFDLVQSSESITVVANLAYAQFCQRAYLKYHWKQSPATGFRGAAKWLTYWLGALLESLVFRKADQIVGASQGLARELSAEYPWSAQKIQVLPNAVDVGWMRRPPHFDRDSLRRELGICASDVGFIFVSLGHFERKGLPQLLEAVSGVSSSGVKLIVVGGMPDLVSAYRQRVTRMGLDASVRFLGIQEDVRPYLWCADVFALPSFYEVFPLVALEAAAAELPLLVTRMNGVEEFLVDGRNGFLVGTTCQEIAEGIKKFVALSPERRSAMGKQAKCSVECYSPEQFVDRWRKIYAGDVCR